VLASRLLVWAVAVVAARTLSVTGSAEAPAGKVVPGLSHPFGHGPLSGVLDALFTPLIRWDALWYLQISRDGYEPLGLVPGNAGERPAFFPLFPLLVHVLGGAAGDAATVIVAALASLVAFAAGLLVVHRLAELELGPDAARGAVLVIAFWPAGPFFSAPYTESLFLALTAGAFLAARTDRWAVAGLLGAAASATRNTGLLLVIPLLVMYLYGPRAGRPAATAARPRLAPRFALRPDVLWLALAPLGLIAYMVFLDAAIGDAQAWRHAQESFGRPELASPLRTLRLGVVGAWHGIRDPGSGLGLPNVLDLATLGVVAVAAVGVARRLPPAYLTWVAVALGPALVAPFNGEALRSLPRFASVVFPLAMWLGWALTRRRLLGPALAVAATLLALTTAAFVVWLPFV
jgi:hypothetical protein